MKKHLLIFAAVLLACALIFCACSDEVAGTEEPAGTEETVGTEESADSSISQSTFVDIRWTRETSSDTEYLRFYSDGDFVYYCACGNPVDDSDLCDGYTYDASTGTITLHYVIEIPGLITSIKVVSCDENTLVLNFGGQNRTFTREDS